MAPQPAIFQSSIRKWRKFSLRFAQKKRSDKKVVLKNTGLGCVHVWVSIPAFRADADVIHVLVIRAEYDGDDEVSKVGGSG